MHNKQLIVDNRAIIVGGRNIGAEYFAENEEMNFADLDVLGFGPVALDGSHAFDQFWNYEYAMPVGALVAAPDDPEAELLALRARLDKSMESLVDTPYAAALKGSALDLVESGAVSVGWYPYELVTDPPSKGRDDIDVSQTIIGPLRSSIEAAEHEFILISPYFVPRKTGIEGFRKLRERGVAVTVVTNSLAATDVAAVHSGYMPARKPLLKMGVDLYEVRADADVAGVKEAGIGHSSASLHTKAFIVDRRKIFIGSFNFDPRSAYINTEMGIILDAPDLAADSAEQLLKKTTLAAYRVVLNENNRLRWIGTKDGQTTVLKKEPQTGFWQRFMAGFMRILPIKGQL
jgi:putative cardiolipin synthase